jgi:hypothetical protein
LEVKYAGKKSKLQDMIGIRIVAYFQDDVDALALYYSVGDIVKKAREIKPDLYVISDAVQHAPHCKIEAEKLGLDGVNFAPYKFFGVRGCGFPGNLILFHFSADGGHERHRLRKCGIMCAI